ncbi:MFS transporter [Virgifigura deserti]|uniref:MFS transporter n=1 Tax=Virgifigura deserti TaxID=2268457 RepID=UPI003CCBBDA3
MTDNCTAQENPTLSNRSDGLGRPHAEAAIPLAVYAFGAGIFSMTTSEFMVAGMMPSLSAAFSVSIPEIGYLISIYAAGMVIGGPLLTVGLLRFSRKTALLLLLAVFILGQALGAMATGYAVMALARAITGVASAAFFAVSLSAAAEMAGSQARGRASSIVLAGLMLATVFGLPMATLIDQHFDWRTSFWVVAVLVLVCTGIVAALTPASARPEKIDLPFELAALKSGKLWAAYATSGLIIAATFAAFSYFSPIFTEVSGFSPEAVPTLYVLYGAATVIGNIVIGRYADRYTMPILVFGLSTLAISLVAFGLLARSEVFTVVATIVLGLVGVTMNPAMAARIMRTANPRPLVNSVHGAIISLGVLVGSWLGGLSISAGFGTVSPLWIGAGLAIIGLGTLAPRSARI